MDFLNKAKAALGGKSGGASHQQTAAGGQKEDYVDKGLAAVQKKMGWSSNRETNEKMTDAGRSFYEKQTGKKMNSKISN